MKTLLNLEKLSLIVTDTQTPQTHTSVIVLQTFWEDVRAEMIDEKGLDPDVADRTGFYVKFQGQYLVNIEVGTGFIMCNVPQDSQ